MATMNEHRQEVLQEIKNMGGREEIKNRMDMEDNTTVKIWIWQYLQSLE